MTKPLRRSFYHDWSTKFFWKLLYSSTNCWNADCICTQNFWHLKYINYATFQLSFQKNCIHIIVKYRPNCMNNIISWKFTTVGKYAASSWNDPEIFNPLSRLLSDKITSFFWNNFSNTPCMGQLFIRRIYNCTKFLCDVIIDYFNWKNSLQISFKFNFFISWFTILINSSIYWDFV